MFHHGVSLSIMSLEIAQTATLATGLRIYSGAKFPCSWGISAEIIGVNFRTRKWTSQQNNMSHWIRIHKMDRTGEFLAICSSYSSGHAPPLLRCPPVSSFDSAARGVAQGIQHVHSSIERIHHATVDSTPTETVVHGMRFVIACGKELASLAELAKRFARSPVGSTRPQLALHRLAITQVLLLRLKRLDVSVRRLTDQASTSASTFKHSDARAMEKRERGSAAAESGLIGKAVAILSRKVAFGLSKLTQPMEGPGSPSLFSANLSRPRAAGSAESPPPALGRGTAAPFAPASGAAPGGKTGVAADSAAAAKYSTSAASMPSAGAASSSSSASSFSAGQLRQDMLQRADDAFDARELERTMRAVSGLVDVIAGHLVSQADSVNFILEAAVESRDNIRSGNRELRAVSERPNTMRDFAVALLLILAFALLLLDWLSKG